MEPVSRRPRNARLTAYYGLKQPADSGATESSPLPEAREDGSWGASELIRRLPLEKLVRTSTMIRAEAEHVERSLHGSVRSCYEQMAAAASECAALRDVCSTLGGDSDGTLARVARACEQSRAISDDMAPHRAAIENLEESRRVMLLLRAAELLARQLPAHLTELTELCTDPQSARDRLFLTAHRCAVILPQLAALSVDAACFRDAHSDLAAAVADVVADLCAQVTEESGSIEGLSLADLMRIRVCLLVEDDEFRAFFLSTATAVLRSRMPDESYGRVSGRSGLARGAFQLRHSANVMLDDIKAISSAYDAVFRGSDCFVARAKKRGGEMYVNDSILSAEDFAVWMAGTLDDLIGAVVRKEVSVKSKAADFGKTEKQSADGSAADSISVKDICDFKDAVSVLRKRSETEGAVDPDTCLAQVPIILGTLCDSICAHVEQAITGRSTMQMSNMLDDALFSDFQSSERGTMQELLKTVAKIEELGQSCDSLLRELVSDDEVSAGVSKPLKSFLSEILALLLRKLNDEGLDNKSSVGISHRALLRGAFICEHVAENSNSHTLSKSLRGVAATMKVDFTKRSVDTVSAFFRTFLFSRDSSLAEAASDGNLIADQSLALLRRARKEVDLFPSTGSSLHDVWRHVPNGRDRSTSMDLVSSDGLDSDGVVHRIAENWTQLVRMSSLSEEKKIAVDAVVSRMGQGLGSAYIFSIVSKAASERCNDM